MKVLRQVNFSLRDRIKEQNARRNDFEFRNRYNYTEDEGVRKEWREISEKNLKGLERNNKRIRKPLLASGALITGAGALQGALTGKITGKPVRGALIGAGAGLAVSGALVGGVALSQKALERKIKKAKENPNGKEAKELERMRDNLRVADGEMSRKAFEKKWYQNKK